MTDNSKTIRPWVRGVFVLWCLVCWTPIIIITWAITTMIIADKYAVKLISEHRQEIVGKPTATLVATLGKPYRVEKEQPRIIETTTGITVRELDPYEVWYYCPWPRYLPCTFGLKAFVKKDIVTGMDPPLD